MTKLIDAHKLFQETEENMHNNPHSNPVHAAMHKHEHCHFLCKIDKQPEIDSIHFAGGCYCKECQYYEPLRDYPDCSKTLPYGFCYYWKYEEGESPNEVDENDFCSKGVITNA